jgi:hypothetical protein
MTLENGMDSTSISTGAVWKDRVVLAGSGLALLLLLLVGAGLFADRALWSDQQRRDLLRCSVCGEELPYSKALDGKPCSVCGEGVFRPGVDAGSGGSAPPSLGSRVIVFACVGGVLVAGVAYLVVRRLGQLRMEDARHRNRKLVCRCPYCERKIAYPASRVGEGAVCSRCKTAFSLPGADQAEEFVETF